MENHTVIGTEAAHVCLSCGHAYVAAGSALSIGAAVVVAAAAGFLTWHAAKLLRPAFEARLARA